MRKMRSNRSSPVAPVAAEGDAAMTMAPMAEMMRSLQATVEASRVEQARIHEDLVASRARNEELSKVTSCVPNAFCSGDYRHANSHERGSG